MKWWLDRNKRPILVRWFKNPVAITLARHGSRRSTRRTRSPPQVRKLLVVVP